MLTVICHSAESQSSQVERDNIVERFFCSSITTFHSSKSNSPSAPKCHVKCDISSSSSHMLGVCVYLISTQGCNTVHCYIEAYFNS